MPRSPEGSAGSLLRYLLFAVRGGKDPPAMRPTQPMRCLRNEGGLGASGHPGAAILHYGPDNERATEVRGRVILGAGEETSELERWHLWTGPANHEEQADRTADRAGLADSVVRRSDA